MLPNIVLILFFTVVCVGLYMGVRAVRNQDIAVQIVYTYGLAVAVGIAVLLYALAHNQIENHGNFVLVLFLVTASGGVVLYRLAKKLSRKPKDLARTHGGFAAFAVPILTRYLT